MSQQCPIDEAGEMAPQCAEARERGWDRETTPQGQPLPPAPVERCFNPTCKRCYPHGLSCRCGDSVGFKSMQLRTIITLGGGAIMILMECAVCKEPVCNYTVTDLDELRAEYSAHLDSPKHKPRGK